MKLTAKSKKVRSVTAAARAHWHTHFVNVHDSIPAEWSLEDERTLLEITCVQAFSKLAKTLSEIESIVSAPVPGDSLTVRYRNFLAWWMMKCPVPYVKPTPYVRRRVRFCIETNLGGIQ